MSRLFFKILIVLTLAFPYFILWLKKPIEGELDQKKPISESVFQRLDSQYCIHYGNEKAPFKIVEYFSFQCPHCIKLFREDFVQIKEKLIDTGIISFEFHPVPLDLPTVQAMVCFEKLEEYEKRLFLEVIFEEAIPGDTDLMPKLMMAAMNVFNKPIPQLNDKDFIQGQQVFEEIYRFIKQEHVLAVPTVEINGRIFADKVPEFTFIKAFIGD